MLLLSITICTFRSAIIAMVLIPVMVGWDDSLERHVCYYWRFTICTFRSAIIAMVLIPVMVGWGDSMEILLLWRPLRMDMWKL